MAPSWKENKNFLLDKQWYVIFTATKCERKVVHRLVRSRIVYWCAFEFLNEPKGKNDHAGSYSAFKSFVFVKVNVQELSHLQNMKGVKGLMYWLQNPVTLPGYEVEQMRKFFEEHLSVICRQIPMTHLGSKVGKSMLNADNYDIAEDEDSDVIVLQSIGFVLYAKKTVTSCGTKQNHIALEIDLHIPAVMVSPA